jgi:hypothetical protein
MLSLGRHLFRAIDDEGDLLVWDQRRVFAKRRSISKAVRICEAIEGRLSVARLGAVRVRHLRQGRRRRRCCRGWSHPRGGSRRRFTSA